MYYRRVQTGALSLRGPSRPVSVFRCSVHRSNPVTETSRGVTCLIHQAKFFFRSGSPVVYEKHDLRSVLAASAVFEPVQGRSEPSCLCSHPTKGTGSRDQMNTWHKRDWKQFYELARRPW